MNKKLFIALCGTATVSIAVAITLLVIILVRNHKAMTYDNPEYTFHVSIEQMFESNTAKAKGIDNTTQDEDILMNMKYLISQVLEPLYLFKTFKINSGFRSSALNKAVGGSSTSQHSKGEAADITTGSKAGNKQLYDYIVANLPYDQLINEKDFSWVHVSLKRTGYNRKQQLKL